MVVWRLLRNNSFILVLALVLGLAVGQPARYTEGLVTPVLAVIMMMSMLSVSSSSFRNLRALVRPSLLSLGLNYVVLSGLLVGLASLLVQERDLWVGYVLVAAAPPAVAVIPFTYRLGGNIDFSLVGAVTSYVAAFALTPFISFLFLGTNLIPPARLLISLAQLIVAPFLVSRAMRTARFVHVLEKHRGLVVNWGFFLVIYTIIGLNREALLGEPNALVRLATVAFACTFLVALGIYVVSRKLMVARADRIGLMVMGAWKNYGLAGAIALSFAGVRASIPAAVATAFAIGNFVWLTYATKKFL